MSANETSWQFSTQITIYKSKPLQVKVRPSTQSLGLHQTASYKEPQKKRETRMNYINRRHNCPDLGQVQTFAAGFNVLIVPNLLLFLKQ